MDALGWGGLWGGASPEGCRLGRARFNNLFRLHEDGRGPASFPAPPPALDCPRTAPGLPPCCPRTARPRNLLSLYCPLMGSRMYSSTRRRVGDDSPCTSARGSAGREGLAGARLSPRRRRPAVRAGRGGGSGTRRSSPSVGAPLKGPCEPVVDCPDCFSTTPPPAPNSDARPYPTARHPTMISSSMMQQPLPRVEKTQSRCMRS
jgi:hypothetical protein